MTTFLRCVERSQVNDPESFAAYAQQMLGSKYPAGREIAVLRLKLNEFQAQNPKVDWKVLVRTIDYMRSKRARAAMPWAVLSFVHPAYRDGFLPELAPRNADLRDSYVEAQIEHILTSETDPWWVACLSNAEGSGPRRELLRLYQQKDLDV